MKKKYIAFIVLFCVIFALLILDISILKNKESNDVSNKNDGNSVTVDDLTEDEENKGEEDSVGDGVKKNIADEEIDSWIEPSTDNATKQESSTSTEDIDASRDEKEQEDDTLKKPEEEKPEWIGGDF